MTQQRNITNEVFAKNLAELMQKLGATQEMISKDLGIAQSAVSNYLKGRVPRVDILLELSGYFGTTPSDLVGGNAVESVQSRSLFGFENATLIADLKNDLAAAQASINDAEAALKKCKQYVSMAKLTAARVESIRKANIRRR